MVDKFVFSMYNQNARNYCVHYAGIKINKGETMKNDIQPSYVEVTFVCACGAEFKGKTSKPGVKENDSVKLEVCDKCHPFFTGQQKLVDTEGRVDKFNKKHNR